MTIKKLPYYSYIRLLKRFRILILFTIFTIVSISAVYIKNDFIYSDKQLWLGGSKEYSKLLALKHPSLNVEKIVVDISSDGWSTKAISKLKSLQLQLIEKEHVVSLKTLFNSRNLFNNNLNDEQYVFEIVSLFDAKDDYIYNEVLKNQNRFKNFYSNNEVTFYVVSDAYVSLSEFICNYPYERSKIESSSHTKDILLFSILFIILAISFTIAFKSFLPTFLGVIFISATTLMTIALYQWISPIQATHISIVLLAVTVSVMDFVYIYYRWHILQQFTHKKLLMYNVVSKTVVPIFWTTFISLIGIGSLMFVDSNILYSLGINIALASSVGFVLSFTLLPVMLSFFKQNKPTIITQNGVKFFADKEAHYQKNILNIFLIISTAVFVYGIFMYIFKPMNVVTDTSGTQISLALKEEGMNHNTILELHNIQNLLEGKFSNEIETLESAYTEIEKLYSQEYSNKIFDIETIDIDSYVYMFDLYDVTKNIMINNHLTLTIYLKNTEKKAQILNFIRDEDILIQDHSSLLQIAKIDSVNTLFIVVFFVLFLIMSIIYHMTKTLQLAWIALLVNAIPLAWFFAIIMLLNIPLSSDMLVSMIITVAISSDATMHFIFSYYNNRLKPRCSEKVLERLFLFIGTPLGMGNIMLILIFIALIFVPDITVSNIGLYSSMLSILSLGMELFVLPVLLLKMVKSNLSLEGYYHGK